MAHLPYVKRLCCVNGVWVSSSIISISNPVPSSYLSRASFTRLNSVRNARAGYPIPEYFFAITSVGFPFQSGNGTYRVVSPSIWCVASFVVRKYVPSLRMPTSGVRFLERISLRAITRIRRKFSGVARYSATAVYRHSCGCSCSVVFFLGILFPFTVVGNVVLGMYNLLFFESTVKCVPLYHCQVLPCPLFLSGSQNCLNPGVLVLIVQCFVNGGNDARHLIAYELHCFYY